MTEIAAALGIVLLLVASAAAGGAVPADRLLLAGAAIAALGLAAGVAAGAVYHLALRRVLAPLGSLPPAWWWHPTRLHDRIPPAARRRVMPWFHAGAAGFLATLAGCAIVLAAILAM